MRMRPLLVWNHEDAACPEVPIHIIQGLIVEWRKCVDGLQAAVCKAEGNDALAILAVRVEWWHCRAGAIASSQKHPSPWRAVVNWHTCAGCPDSRTRSVWSKA